MVEEDCANVIQMPVQCEETPASLVRPDLDLIIVSTRNKERLCLVEVDSPDGPIVLLESINQCPHSIVP